MAGSGGSTRESRDSTETTSSILRALRLRSRHTGRPGVGKRDYRRCGFPNAVLLGLPLIIAVRNVAGGRKPGDLGTEKGKRRGDRRNEGGQKNQIARLQIMFPLPVLGRAGLRRHRRRLYRVTAKFCVLWRWALIALLHAAGVMDCIFVPLHWRWTRCGVDYTAR